MAFGEEVCNFTWKKKGVHPSMLDIYGIIGPSTRLEELISIHLIMDELLDFCDPLI